MNKQTAESQYTWTQQAGLIVGPLAALLIVLWFRPTGLGQPAIFAAGVATWMAIWWASEALPIAVTAFLPLVLFPILGVAPIAQAAAPYANPIIYLYLGGFIVALAIERANLHKRIALRIFKAVGLSGKYLVGGFMFAAALISMWISNTSTTLMLLPIVVSLALVVRETNPELSESELGNFQTSLLLGLAYGASIGGVATLVGTPTNAFMAGFMQSSYGVEIDFARWMMVGVPVACLLLPASWLILTGWIFPVRFRVSKEAGERINAHHRALGTMSKAEVRIAILFALLVAGWLLRKPLIDLTGAAELTDTAIAMIAAILAFVIPSGTDGKALVTWEDTKRLPWGVLILFGGGLSLADSLSSTGMTLWLGQQLAPLGLINFALLVIAITTLVIFLTELTSNVATTATLLPVVAAIGVEMGLDPLVFVIPLTLAASCAFMLPVATPPNAIVFSSGYVSIGQMMRAGFVLNLVGIVILSLVALFLVPIIF